MLKFFFNFLSFFDPVFLLDITILIIHQDYQYLLYRKENRAIYREIIIYCYLISVQLTDTCGL